MKHGRHGNIWIGLYTKQDEDARSTYDLILECQTSQEVEDTLINNGFVHVDTRHSKGSGQELLFANHNNILVEVYYFHRRELTINIKDHGFDSPEALKRFWTSFEEICNMSPLEMQS